MSTKTSKAAKPAEVAKQRPSLIATMASKHGLEPAKFMETVKATAFRGSGKVSDEEFAAFMMVANKYDLDPFLGQIHAFPSQGGIVPFVGIDGWISLINRQERHSGLEVIEEETESGKPNKTTVRIFISGYTEPVTITERFSECARETKPWKSHPFRMLRHKAIVQCARVAYGFAGLHDEDEAYRVLEMRGEVVEGVVRESAQALPTPRDPERVPPKPPAPVERVDDLVKPEFSLDPEEAEPEDVTPEPEPKEEPKPKEEKKAKPKPEPEPDADEDSFDVRLQIVEFADELGMDEAELHDKLEKCGSDKRKLQELRHHLSKLYAEKGKS